VELPRYKAPEKETVTIDHNLFDLMGKSLLEGIKTGGFSKADTNALVDRFSFMLGIDLGEGLGVSAGYNVPGMRGGPHGKDQFRVGITKDIF